MMATTCSWVSRTLFPCVSLTPSFDESLVQPHPGAPVAGYQDLGNGQAVRAHVLLDPMNIFQALHGRPGAMDTQYYLTCIAADSHHTIDGATEGSRGRWQKVQPIRNGNRRDVVFVQPPLRCGQLVTNHTIHRSVLTVHSPA